MSQFNDSHLKEVDKFLWTWFRTEMNWGHLKYSKNSHGVYLRPVGSRGSASKKKMEDVLKKLPKTIAHYQANDGTHIFSPYVTNEDKVKFAEACACSVGQRLLAHQEETIKIMAEYKEVLESLKKAKDALTED